MSKDLIIGIAGGLLTSGLIFMFKHSLKAATEFLFLKTYPKIKGEYNIYTYSVNDASGEIHPIAKKYNLVHPKKITPQLIEHLKATNTDTYLKANIRQIGYKLRGTIHTIENGNAKNKVIIWGRLTASRIVLLNFESKDGVHLNFGNYLLNINPDSNILNGSCSFLCSHCGDIAHDYVFFERVL